MKTIFKKIKLIVLLLVVGCSIDAQPSLKENEFEKSKTFTQSYDLTGSEKVSVTNQFGNIKIVTWNDSKLKVDVEIKVNAKTEEKATKIIDGIVISHNKTNSQISFKTLIGNNSSKNSYSNTTSSNGGKTTTTTNGVTVTTSDEDGSIYSKTGDNCNCGSGNNNNQSMKINYTIYIPTSNTLKLHNSFGNIMLDDYKGALTITEEYGNLLAGIINNESNEISVEYGNADIKSLTNPDFKIAYGNCDINSINGKGEMRFEYAGDVSLGLDTAIGDLKISNDYSTMEITLNENANANFIINSSYGEVKNKHKKLVLKTDSDDNNGCCNFTKKYEGKIGNGLAKVKITNEYGNVKIR